MNAPRRPSPDDIAHALALPVDGECRLIGGECSCCKEQRIIGLASIAKATDMELTELREIVDARRGDPNGRRIEVVLEVE